MSRLNHRRLIVAFFAYAAALLSVPSPARAEDTDIFSINPAIASQRPNVLIILDSSANWASTDSVAGGKKYQHVAAAMVSTISGLTDQFNVGLMMYAETGNPNDNIDGGVMRAGVRQMSVANRTALVNFFSTVDADFDKSNNTSMGMAFNEAYLYFGGKAAYSGIGKAKRDHGGAPVDRWATVGASQQGAPAAMKTAVNNLYQITPNALTSSASTSYNSPVTDACQKNFIIYIANGPITDPSASNAEATSKLAAAGGDTSTINFLQNDGDEGNVSDEWTRFLASTDVHTGQTGKQNVVTYAVEVNPLSNTQGLNNTELLKSVAQQGKGKYFGVTSAGGGAAIADALNQIFAEIMAVNSVFAAATLPVNVAVRGFHLNQIYMGVFRPDANSSPRWPGNVKQYSLGLTVSGNLLVVDKNLIPIENATSGFVNPTAQSYWTVASTFWDNTYYPDTVAQPPMTPSTSDLPDGEFVEKGGAAQHLRTVHATDVTTRRLYTCVGCPNDTPLTSSTNFEFVEGNGAITDAMLGITAGKSVTSLTRSGTTATATSAAHGFSNNAVVQITGANEGAYNGTYNITVGADPNTFTYQIVESPVTPATTASTMRAAKGAGVQSIVSITRVGATATVTTTLPHNFSDGNTITITGSADSGYNGSFVIANAGTLGVSTTFTYTVAETPATPATAAGTATVNGVQRNIKTNPTIGVTRSGTTVTVETTNNHGFAVNDLVTVAGVTPNEYNVTNVAITGVPGNKLFTYTLPTAVGPATPALGGSASSGTVLTVSSITRTGSVATVITTVDPVAAGFVNGDNITISGADQAEYNGTFPIAALNAAARRFTYTPVPLNPATTATGTITATGAGGVTKPQLINWVRGANVQLDDNPNVTPTASATRVRGYLHGDVLHSRPAVVNYNRAGQPAQRDLAVFYGANDGIIHAVKGGQNDADGDESWGFIPQEFYDRFSRLYLESPKISTTARRNYFVDGPITAYTVYVNDSSTPPVPRLEGTGAKAQIYVGMRRGGRFYYSLDVLNPSAPVFKWKIDNTMLGFTELGQSWSEMAVEKVKINAASCPSALDSEGNCRVLIFGAGYDAAANDPDVQGTATMGRGIYVVDATSGALIWHASNAATMTMPVGAVYRFANGMDYAIPADVRTLNSDGDSEGVADRIYAPDTGGNIWRVNISNADPSQWTVGKIAELSGGAAADKRKFLFPPDTVKLNSTTRAILIGSGDREHPFDTTINNRFYMIKDDDGLTSLQATVHETDLCDLTGSPVQGSDLTAAADATACLANASKKGWYMILGAGEKVVGGSTTLAGTTVFATNTPASVATPGSCTGNLGEARIYAVGLTDATATIDFNGDGILNAADLSTEKAGGAFVPTGVPVLTEAPLIHDSGGAATPPDGGSGDRVVQCVVLGVTVVCPKEKTPDERFRTFWNLSIDN